MPSRVPAARAALTGLVLVVAGVALAQAPGTAAAAAAPTISPATVDWAPGSTAYQDISVSSAAWTLRDTIRVAIPGGLGVRIAASTSGGGSCSAGSTTSADCTPSGASGSLRVTYSDNGSHALGTYGKSFAVTVTDLATGESRTATVRVTPKADLRIAGPYGDSSAISLTVDDKSGPSIADNVRVHLTVIGNLVTSVPSNCSGSLSSLTCDLGDIDPGTSVGLSLPVKVGTSGFITVTAAVSSDWSDPNPANNFGTAGPYDPTGGTVGRAPSPQPGQGDSDGGGAGGGAWGGGTPGAGTPGTSGGPTPTGGAGGGGGPSTGIPSGSAQPSDSTGGPAPSTPGAGSDPQAAPVHGVLPGATGTAELIGTLAAVAGALVLVAAAWWYRRRMADPSGGYGS